MAVTCSQVDAASSEPPAPSGNLVANGGFERGSVGQSPDGWILKAWEGRGAGQVTSGGRFGRNFLKLSSASSTGLYGCHTQPIEVGRYAGREMLMSLHYRTEGHLHADALIVTFADDFTDREWETTAVSRHELTLEPSSNWVMLSRHLDLPPNARHALVVLRIAGEGSLSVDGVNLRSLPAEVTCEVRGAGLVADARTRTTQMVLTNGTSTRSEGTVVVQIWDGKTLRNTVQRPYQLGAGQDQRVSVDYSLDYQTAHRLRISVFGAQEHEVYEDLSVQIPALVDAHLTAPAFRSTMLNGVPPDALMMTGRVHATEQLIQAAEVTARIAGTAEISGGEERVPVNDDGTFNARIVPPSMASGPYHLSVNARIGELTLTLDLPFTKAAPDQRHVAYDDRGLLWPYGKAVFPVGMAYLWEPEDLAAVVEAGFNFVTVPARTASTTFMDQADASGIGVFISSASVERDFWANTWRKHRSHNSLWGWYILERPDAYGASVRPELLESLFSDLQELAPYHPVLCALSSSDGLARFAEANDIVIAWTEPNSPGELSSVARHVTQAREITASSKPVWALVPAAGAAHTRDGRLDPTSAGRAPTAAEYRAMVYLSLLSGAQGIVSYTYRIQGDAQRRDWLITRDAPDLWQQVIAVNRELSAIGPSLLNGTRQQGSSGHGAPVQYGVWHHDGQALVILVNTTGQPQVADIVVESLTQPLLQSLTGPNRLEGTAQGHFAQSLAPYEAGVFMGRVQANP